MVVDGSARADEAVQAALRARVDEERARLQREAGLPEIRHFRRPAERPFVADERDRVTLLIGGLTARHDVLIQAVFHGSGYRCERLPVPDVAACQIGKEFGNVGQCNPTYFTIGALITYLRQLEARGLTRQQIVDQYVFFTAGSCGPCRFGMYETEYRSALQNAGYAGFRVLVFQQTDGINAAGEPGLKFTVNFGMGMLNALLLADVLNDVANQIRPFEVVPGETDRAAADVLDDMARFLRERRAFELMEDGPHWLTRRLATRPTLKNVLSVLCKVYDHVYGRAFRRALRAWRARLDAVEIDRLRVKPVVKITGEFWAQTTEGDGNFRIFEFLEREGAQVITEPVATWLTYMIHLERMASVSRRPVEAPFPRAAWWQLRRRAVNAATFQRKALLLDLGEGLLMHFHHRLGARLGRAHRLAPQSELARLAHPYYHQLARGGEGSMEVGKNVYYSLNRLCHMVLALKPFGCMPSSQSDGVQAAVTSHFKDMIFLPVETAGEGEINAHSRVQMALADARTRARAEFDDALAASGHPLERLRAYVARHPQLRRPFHPIARRPGVTGTAAQFVRHVGALIDAEAATESRRREAPLVRMPTW